MLGLQAGVEPNMGTGLGSLGAAGVEMLDEEPSAAPGAPRKGIMAERLAAISFSLSEAAFESSSSCSSGPCRVRMAPVVVFVVDLA